MIMFHPDMPRFAVEKLRATLTNWPGRHPDYCEVALWPAMSSYGPDYQTQPTDTLMSRCGFRRRLFNEDVRPGAEARQITLIEPDTEQDFDTLRAWVATDPQSRHPRYR